MSLHVPTGRRRGSLNENGYTDIAFAWELFDALVFSLTVAQTLKMREQHNMETSLSGNGAFWL